MTLATQESQHANMLYDMFRRKEKPEDMADKDYSAMLKEILDKFADGMAKFEAMKKSIHDEVAQKALCNVQTSS